MSYSEKKLDGKTVYAGKILTLTVDDVLLPDGKKSKRECVHHSGGAAVLYVREGKVLLVKQFRYLYGKEIYEIPAGKLEKGEEPLLAAARELEEETGYRPEKLVHYLNIYPTPGYTDEVIRVFFAENCTFAGQKLDEGEFLNLEFIDLKTVVEMINSGEICDAKTISAVFKYLSENN